MVFASIVSSDTYDYGYGMVWCGMPPRRSLLANLLACLVDFLRFGPSPGALSHTAFVSL